MKRLVLLTGLVLSILSRQAFSAEIFVSVFLDSAPLTGVSLSLDGDALPNTDSRGGSNAELEAGSHTLTIVQGGRKFSVQFDAATQEDVEISTTFSGDDTSDPIFKTRKFTPGDTSGFGFVTGQIVDSIGTPLAGATVQAVGTSFRALADGSGVYRLEIPRGLYDLEVVAVGYDDVVLRDVRVLADLGVSAKITLQADDGTGVTPQQMEEVFVLGVFNPQEDAASIERFATSVTNAIDIAQLERFGDSDIASALNRVVGVAVTDSRYATVRGLDGRYISSTFNGLLMPSTDPQRRDVQLDLFPTDILEGIEIQKSYTPDQLATTTGGSIKIFTKSIPDERIIKLSGSIGVNADFTGDKILTYRESNDDWIGFDSGLRELPDGVLAATNGGTSLTVCDPAIDPVLCTSEEDAAALGVLFQDDYNVKTTTALPDVSLSGVIGDRLPLGNNEWGYYLALSYDRSTGDRGNAELSNPLGTTGEYMRSKVTVDLNGYAALGYEFGDAGEILSKTTLLRSSDNTTRYESGVDSRDDNQIDKAILQWVERQFLSQSFTGHDEIEFDEGVHKFDWRAAFSRTLRDEPDRRQYTYFNNNLSTSAFERRWSELEEDSVDLGLDYALELNWGAVSTTELKVGALWSDKEREVDQYRFGIRPGDRDDLDLGIDQDLEDDVLPYYNFALDRVRLAANTTSTDSYDSEEETRAFYLSANTEFGEDWTLLVGARYEDFRQFIGYPNDVNLDSELEFDDWYPAVNLAWRPLEDWQFRVGYSQTVSYPGLIERSEAETFDPETDDRQKGNSGLLVSTIDNYDFRAEYYFSDEESVSLAIFSKDISNPVERAILDGSGSAAEGTTWVNQEGAELFGVELDANLNVLERTDYLLSVGGNIAYIDSKVDFNDDSIRLEGASSNGRALQGQSEWLANIQFAFDHYPTEQKFTLLLNYFDNRIFRISRGTNTGPVYETARTIVDLVYEKMISENFTVDAAIKNLLNDEVEYSRDGTGIESYETGIEFSVGVSYQF